MELSNEIKYFSKTFVMNNFVTVRNNYFNIDGKPFRFIGVNMYELAYVNPETAQIMVEDAFNEGYKVIRFWAFDLVEKENLEKICNAVEKFNIKLIPVLADMKKYLQSFEAGKHWFKKEYKEKYLSHVRETVSMFKDRSEILLWELINEPYSDTFSEFYNFADDVSAEVKRLDGNHLVSIGTIGGIGDRFGNFFSRFNLSNFKKLYSINSLDAVSIHDYSFNSTLFERLDIMYRLNDKKQKAKLFSRAGRTIDAVPHLIDKYTVQRFGKTLDFPFTIRSIWRNFISKNISAAKELNKPVYIGEIGFKKNPGEFRKIILECELKKYSAGSIAGILLWSFESQGKSLDGHDYGFGIEDGFGEVVSKIKLNTI